MKSEFPHFPNEDSDTDSHHGDQPEDLYYPSDPDQSSYINDSIISESTVLIQFPHHHDEYRYQLVQNISNDAYADPTQSPTVCQDRFFDHPQHEETPARDSIKIQAQNHSELDDDPVVYHTIEAQQLSEQITSAIMAPKSQEETAQIAVVGTELNDDENSKICNQITILLRQFTVPNSAPPRFIRTEPKGVNASIIESSHLCVYTLPRSGALEEDAMTLIRISRVLPVLVVVISSEDLTVADILKLHQAMARYNIPEYQQLISTLLQSCVSIKGLPTVDVQNIMKRGKLVSGGSFDDSLFKMARTSWSWNDLSLIGMFTHKFAKFAVLVFAIAVLFCITTFEDVVFPQPSHAVLRRIQYHRNGRSSVAHLDLYTSNGDSFESIHQHNFHVRILNQHKRLLLEEVPSDNVPIIVDPIIEDLGNGTYKIYTTILRNRNRNPSSGLLINSWLCGEKPRYYLHLWFENGTHVMDTPQELIWPKLAPAQIVESQSHFGEGQDVFEEEYPFLNVEFDLKGDEGDAMLTAWKERTQFLPRPLAAVASNLMNPMMSEYWEIIQPVVCTVQVVAHTVVLDALQRIELILGVVSGLVETFLDALHFTFNVLSPLLQEFIDGFLLNGVPKVK
ncbi:hypothetical protein BGX21_010389 [Mortierella sp. AD011]|nr:hypothetical protein BGX20_010606 [Mortierella sp. AD010]KAF9402347.1 hypothetical protein BGX21_010389 [Mortierella sp. AD011]